LGKIKNNQGKSAGIPKPRNPIRIREKSDPHRRASHANSRNLMDPGIRATRGKGGGWAFPGSTCAHSGSSHRSRKKEAKTVRSYPKDKKKKSDGCRKTKAGPPPRKNPRIIARIKGKKPKKIGRPEGRKARRWPAHPPSKIQRVPKAT